MDRSIYAEIIVNVPHRRVDRVFHYQVPQELIRDIYPGRRVQVPFGNRCVEGIVIDVTDTAPDIGIKSIEKVLDAPALPRDLLELARWIADIYFCPYIDALNTVAPTKFTKRRRQRTHADRQITPTMPLCLTADQQIAVTHIIKTMENHESEVVLLHGVTGSGKTEVYLQSIQAARLLGRQAIVLVPEIALTPQMEERFLARFGNRAALVHSRLSDGERSEAWRRMRDKELDVVVGARSAVFAPFEDIGLIILDEEHEFTYKQEDNPKYHTRDVAIQRARHHGAVVILGSATPSVETYYQAHQGNYRLLELPRRVQERYLPVVDVVDMREELKKKNRSVFSGRLRNEIAARLSRGEQTILLLNRRGFSTFVLCRDCGLVLRCPHCSVSLTYHASDNTVRCHYCQHRQISPEICPVCRSHYIRYFGAGTQKVEEELVRLFPAVRVLRMDADTTTKKDSHQEILASFQRGDADVLLGTQMIAKGLDYPNVTLVGVITADTALNLPDFRAGERTFQLLTQVAGRAGRGEVSGQVIIQTYNPGHYSIQAAQTHDYRAFYQQEITVRQDLCYPPFHSLIKIVVSGDDEREVIRRIENILQRAEQSASTRWICMEFLGPSPAPLGRLKNQFRWQLFFKGPEKQSLHTVLVETMNEAMFAVGGISIDVDPVSML
jgi:primosomal protein N' (replication factor Y) (superfamily II helicase)